MPRLDPNTNKAIVSDVCLKRKVRNYVSEFAPARNGKGYDILMRQGAVLNTQITRGCRAAEE
jgi:CRISPR-associated protein Csd2